MVPTATTTSPRPLTDGALAQVIAQLAAEVSGPLTQALHRVVTLASSGHIDRHGLAALRSEIDGARRAGLLGQRIARFADAPARPGVEQVDLSLVLREVLTQLAAHARPGAPGHRHTLTPTTVLGDVSLLHTVVDAAAAWAQTLAAGVIEWQLEPEPRQRSARLACRFTLRTDASAAPDAADGLDSLDWLLLRYAAHVAGVAVTRDGRDHLVRLSLRLPQLLGAPEPAPGVEVTAVELDTGPSTRALLTGCQLLVLAARREPRLRVREALRGHDVFIDEVPTVAAAEAYCDDGSPQVLLYDAAFDGAPLHDLQARLSRLTPAVTMVELRPDGQGCEMGDRVIRLGAADLAQTLPAVLLMELARQA